MITRFDFSIWFMMKLLSNLQHFTLVKMELLSWWRRNNFQWVQHCQLDLPFVQFCRLVCIARCRFEQMIGTLVLWTPSLWTRHRKEQCERGRNFHQHQCHNLNQGTGFRIWTFWRFLLPGCDRPWFGKKSAFPNGSLNPNVPPFVCMTSTYTPSPTATRSLGELRLNNGPAKQTNDQKFVWRCEMELTWIQSINNLNPATSDCFSNHTNHVTSV